MQSCRETDAKIIAKSIQNLPAMAPESVQIGSKINKMDPGPLGRPPYELWVTKNQLFGKYFCMTF